MILRFPRPAQNEVLYRKACYLRILRALHTARLAPLAGFFFFSRDSAPSGEIGSSDMTPEDITRGTPASLKWPEDSVTRHCAMMLQALPAGRRYE